MHAAGACCSQRVRFIPGAPPAWAGRDSRHSNPENSRNLHKAESCERITNNNPYGTKMGMAVIGCNPLLYCCCCVFLHKNGNENGNESAVFGNGAIVWSWFCSAGRCPLCQKDTLRLPGQFPLADGCRRRPPARGDGNHGIGIQGIEINKHIKIMLLWLVM
jgi:hypothetical protein